MIVIFAMCYIEIDKNPSFAKMWMNYLLNVYFMWKLAVANTNIHTFLNAFLAVICLSYKTFCYQIGIGLTGRFLTGYGYI